MKANQHLHAVRSGVRGLRPLAFAIAILLLSGGSWAHAQGPAAEPAPAEPPSFETTPPPHPGLFGTVGRWLDNSFSNMRSGLKGATEQVQTLGGQAKDAAAAVTRLPGSTVVIGRERCESAPNGAPDCRSAIIALCRTKGYSSGRSIDIQTSRKCSAQGVLAGRRPEASDCITESYVARAMCQ